MTEEKRKQIYKMFDSIGHELLHKQQETVRGSIIWKYDNPKDYITLIESRRPKCIIYDYRRKTTKGFKLVISSSYLN